MRRQQSIKTRPPDFRCQRRRRRRRRQRQRDKCCREHSCRFSTPVTARRLLLDRTQTRQPCGRAEPTRTLATHSHEHRNCSKSGTCRCCMSPEASLQENDAGDGTAPTSGEHSSRRRSVQTRVQPTPSHAWRSEAFVKFPLELRAPPRMPPPSHLISSPLFCLLPPLPRPLAAASSMSARRLCSPAPLSVRPLRRPSPLCCSEAGVRISPSVCFGPPTAPPAALCSRERCCRRMLIAPITERLFGGSTQRETPLPWHWLCLCCPVGCAPP